MSNKNDLRQRHNIGNLYKDYILYKVTKFNFFKNRINDIEINEYIMLCITTLLLCFNRISSINSLTNKVNDKSKTFFDFFSKYYSIYDIYSNTILQYLFLMSKKRSISLLRVVNNYKLHLSNTINIRDRAFRNFFRRMEILNRQRRERREREIERLRIEQTLLIKLDKCKYCNRVLENIILKHIMRIIIIFY